ncbi:MAG: hypothetical protein M9952_06180 [Microthrixaceae bacterium]|nr:hypothetical protein [Microthrixaceae bacterium]
MSELGTTAVGTLATLPDPTLVEEHNPISFRFPRRTWLLIGLATLVAGVLASLATLALPEQYAVTRTLFVMNSSNPTDIDTLTRLLEELIADKGFAMELKQMADVDLPVEKVKSMVSTNRPPLSASLDVVVRAADRETAATLSAAIVPTLEKVFETPFKNVPISSRIATPVVLDMWEGGVAEQEYVPWWMGFVAGAAVAFMFGFVVAAYRQYRRPVIASARDVGEALDLPVLARVATIGDGRGTNPSDAVLGMLSAIERLGTAGPIHRLVVVGPEADLERSKLVLALGCAIARNFDQPVAIVDADLQNASLSKLVGAIDEPGLAECLSGDLRVDQTLLRIENGHMPAVLDSMAPPAGMIRLMPAGIDRSGNLLRMRSNLHQVLGTMSGKYVVIIDGPQVPGSVPTHQLLTLADATVVVVTEGGTSIRDARFTGNAVRSNTTNPVGAVVLRR